MANNGTNGSGLNGLALNGLSISSVIANGGITKSGAGVLSLSGNNTFAGQLTVETGVLNVNTINGVSANGVLGNSSLSVILGKTGGNTGTLEYSGGNNSSTKPFTIAGGGTGAIQVDTDNITLTLSGLINENGTGGGVLAKTGSGTLTLSGSNTYTGGTEIRAGTLKVSSIATSGDATSNLGIGTTISLGGSGTAGALSYTGSAKTTDRVLNLSGTTQGSDAIIDQSGSGALKFSANLTNAAAVSAISKTLTLQGSTSGTGELAGNIPEASNTVTNVSKSGSGTWKLSGPANTYTGSTTVNAGTLIVSGSLSATSAVNLAGGTLQMGASDLLNDTASLTLSGGTFKTSGFSEGTAATAGLGTFNVLANSTLDFGSAVSILHFSAVGTHTASTTLSITNWSGTPGTPGGNSRLIFTGDDFTQFTSAFSQSDVSFNGTSGYTANYLGNGSYEIVAIPEPGTWACIGLGLGLIAYRRRQLRRA